MSKSEPPNPGTLQPPMFLLHNTPILPNTAGVGKMKSGASMHCLKGGGAMYREVAIRGGKQHKNFGRKDAMAILVGRRQPGAYLSMAWERMDSVYESEWIPLDTVHQGRGTDPPSLKSAHNMHGECTEHFMVEGE